MLQVHHDKPPLTPDAVIAECRKRTNQEIKRTMRKYEAYRKNKNNKSYDNNPRLLFQGRLKTRAQGRERARLHMTRVNTTATKGLTDDPLRPSSKATTQSNSPKPLPPTLAPPWEP